MTQYAKPSLVATTDDGVSLSTKFNGAVNAVYSTSSGSTTPPSPVEGQQWIDTTNIGGSPSTVTVKTYLSSSWRTMGTLNITSGVYTVTGGFSAAGGALTGPLTLPDGTVSAPSLTFTGDMDTGIYRVGGGQLAITGDGVIQMGFRSVAAGGPYMAGNLTLTSGDLYIGVDKTVNYSGGAYHGRASVGHFFHYVRSDYRMYWSGTDGAWRWQRGGPAFATTDMTLNNGYLSIPLDFTCQHATASGTVQAGYIVSTGQVRAKGGVSYADTGDLSHIFSFGWDSGSGIPIFVDATAVGYMMRGGNVRYMTMADWGGTWSLNVQQVDSNGAIFFPTATYSDGRLKENVRATSVDALAAVLASPVMEFDFNERGLEKTHRKDPHVRIGLIADSLQIPEAVLTPTVEQDPEQCRAIKMDAIIPYLMRSIQQQQDIIKGLEAKLSKLESSVNATKA